MTWDDPYADLIQVSEFQMMKVAGWNSERMVTSDVEFNDGSKQTYNNSQSIASKFQL